MAPSSVGDGTARGDAWPSSRSPTGREFVMFATENRAGATRAIFRMGTPPYVTAMAAGCHQALRPTPA